MSDIVLDADHLPEFLRQYYSALDANRGYGRFRENSFFGFQLCRALNTILGDWKSVAASGSLPDSLVIVSVLAIVELGRKWTQMVGDSVLPFQLAELLSNPPEWISIAPLDEDLLPSFCDVPQYVRMPDGTFAPVEWTDAVYVAIVFSRDNNAILASGDSKLAQIPSLEGRVLS